MIQESKTCLEDECGRKFPQALIWCVEARCIPQHYSAVPFSIGSGSLESCLFFEDVAVAMFHGKEPKDDQARKSWEPVDAVANTRQCWQASTSEVAPLRDAVAKLERGRCK